LRHLTTASNNGNAAPKTIEEVLNYKFTLEIPQQDLINALADVQKSVLDGNPNLPFPFKITFGEGLQAEGITRNQPIRNFKMENATTAEILTGLVMKANPVTTVKVPSEKDQKLVWVIGPDPADPSKQAVLITTRAAVEKAKLKLPAVFELKM
jgi:eukaryotic-like serine/threonine-protein kinase